MDKRKEVKVVVYFRLSKEVNKKAVCGNIDFQKEQFLKGLADWGYCEGVGLDSCEELWRSSFGSFSRHEV